MTANEIRDTLASAGFWPISIEPWVFTHHESGREVEIRNAHFDSPDEQGAEAWLDGKQYKTVKGLAAAIGTA